MRRPLLWLSLALSLAAVSCSHQSIEKPPAPPVTLAPTELGGLRIHVHQYVSPPETPEDEYDYHHMPGYTATLRGAFEGALVRAGYKVIVGRREPCDLVANIQADWPTDTAGVATLTLTADGQVVEQLSALVPLHDKSPYTEYLEEHGATRLADAMTRSPVVIALAHRRAQPQVKKIAAPPE